MRSTVSTTPGKTQRSASTPAIFGMNFQTVSVAEKIRSTPTTLIGGPDGNRNYTTSAPEAGGYQRGRQSARSTGPRPLERARLRRRSTWPASFLRSTRTASRARLADHRHGKARPVAAGSNELRTVKDGPIISAINAAWAQTHPSNTSLIVAGTDDDLWQSYLSDNLAGRLRLRQELPGGNHTAQGFDVSLNPVTVQHSGLAQIRGRR